MSEFLSKVAKEILYVLFVVPLIVAFVYMDCIGSDLCIFIKRLLIILYISGSLFHESGHYNLAKFLGVKKVCVKFQYLIILRKTHIHKDEEDELSVNKLFLICIGGFLFSLIPILYFWYIKWIEAKCLLLYVIILFLASGDDFKRFKDLLEKKKLNGRVFSA